MRRGRGFSYRNSDGTPVTDKETQQRIKDLVIPPACKKVWICPCPNGHIQAVGTDAAGRRHTEDNPATPRVLGLIISPRTKSSFLGYERSDADAPVMLAALLRWRHRGTFLAAWDDVARVGSDLVRLRSGYTRYSAMLREADDRHV